MFVKVTEPFVTVALSVGGHVGSVAPDVPATVTLNR